MSTETRETAPETSECGDCGQGFLIGDGCNVGQRDPVCGSCADDYCKCTECEEWLKTEDARSVNDARMCEGCADEYMTCDYCDKQALSDEMHGTEQDTAVCPSCADRHYTYSDPQETLIRDGDCVTLADSGDTVSLRYARENYSYCESNDEWYADDDNVPADEDDGDVYESSEDVLDHCDYDSVALRHGALMFGVELEMEPQSGHSQSDVVNALGGRDCERFILKEDGSLTNGVELVTVPLTLDGHRSTFGWDCTLAGVLRCAKSGADTTNCGMHVHINKAALSPLVIGKMLVFLNSPKMRDQVATIAQRESNGYCERSAKKIADGKKRSCSRYDIANVGDKTVEIRMFRGNLRHERVIKNVEFCHALVTYCGDASLATLENWQTFATWLMKRRGQYPALVKFLANVRASGFIHAVRARTDKPEEVLACA